MNIKIVWRVSLSVTIPHYSHLFGGGRWTYSTLIHWFFLFVVLLFFLFIILVKTFDWDLVVNRYIFLSPLKSLSFVNKDGRKIRVVLSGFTGCNFDWNLYVYISYRSYTCMSRSTFREILSYRLLHINIIKSFQLLIIIFGIIGVNNGIFQTTFPSVVEVISPSVLWEVIMWPTWKILLLSIFSLLFVIDPSWVERVNTYRLLTSEF